MEEVKNLLEAREKQLLLLESAWNSQPETNRNNQSETSRNNQSQSNWKSHYFITSCSIMVLANAPKSDNHEAMEEAENHLQKPVLPKLEESQWI